MVRTTRDYENRLLSGSDLSLFLPSVRETLEKGVVSRRQGIPHILERVTHYSVEGKAKILKIFGVECRRKVYPL